MRGVIKTLVVLAICLVIFGLLANLAVDNQYTQRWARNFINTQLDDHTYLKVGYESASLSFMPLKLRLFGVTVADVRENDAKPLLKASQISVSVSFLDILFGHRRLDEILFVDLSGMWPPPKPLDSYLKNPPKPTPSSMQDGIVWPPTKMEVPVHNIKLVNANVELGFSSEDPKATMKEIDLGLGGADIRLILHSWTSMEAGIFVRSLNFADQSRHIFSNASVETKIILSSDSIVAKNVSINSKRLTSAGDVKMKLLTKPAPDAEGRLKVGPPDPEKKGAKSFFKGLVRAVEDQKAPRLIYGMQLSTDLKLNGEASLAGVLFNIDDTYGLFSSSVKMRFETIWSKANSTKLGGEFFLKCNETVLSGFSLFQSEVRGTFNTQGINFKSVKVIDEQKVLAEAKGTLGFTGPVKYDFDIKANKLALSDLMYVLNVDFDTVDFDIDSEELHLSGTGQPFDMRVSGPGVIRRLDVPKLKLTPQQVESAPECLIDLQLTVNKMKMGLTGSSLRCHPKSVSETPLSELRLNGDVQFQPKPLTDLHFTANDWHLNNLSFLVPGGLAGRGPLDVRVQVNNGKLLVQTNIDFKQFKVGDFHLGHLTGELQVQEDVLKWERVEATYPKGGKLSLANGNLHFNEELTFSTQIKALGIGSELFEDITSVDASGQHSKTPAACKFSLNSASGFVQGPLTKLFLWQGDVSAHLSDMKCGKESYFSSLKVIVVSDSDVIDFSRIQVEKDTLFLKGRGSITRDASGKNAVRKDPKYQALYNLGYSDADQLNFIFDLGGGALDSNLGLRGPVKAVTEKDLATLPVIGPSMVALGLAGDIDAQILITGTLMNPLGSFNSQLYNVSFNGNYIDPIYLKGDLQNGKLNSSFRLGRNQILGSFVTQIEGDMAYQLNINTDDLDLRPFMGAFAYGDEQNKVGIDLDWEQKGVLSNWWGSTGSINIKEFGAELIQRSGYQNSQLKFGIAKATKVDIRNGYWNIADGQALTIKGDLLEAQIKTNQNRPNEDLGISFTGLIDMRVLQLFSQEIESASGKLDLSGKIFGKIGDVKLEGLIEDQKTNPMIASRWQPVSVGFASIRPKFDNIDVKIRFDQNYLFIDHLTSKKGIGEVSAQGKLALSAKVSDQNSINIQLNHASISFPVKLLKSVDAVVSGNLALTGNKRPYNITGKLDVIKARSYRNFDLQEEILNLIGEKSFSLKTLASQPLLTFDIDISADRSIRIANKTIQSLISADLRLFGDDVKPLLGGQIEIHRGTFYYKRDFVFSTSYITFDDPTQINPSLDISAIADAGTYRVFLDIGGRLQNPQVDLRTDPNTHPDGGEISRLDILVLLSTGRLPERNRTVGEAQDVAIVEAANLLAGRFDQPLQKLMDFSGQSIVREPFSDFEISQSGNGIVPRVNLPLVYRDINAVVRINTAGEWEVSSEYPLHDNISLTGSMEGRTEQSTTSGALREEQDKSNAAIDLKFRFSFP